MQYNDSAINCFSQRDVDEAHQCFRGRNSRKLKAPGCWLHLSMNEFFQPSTFIQLISFSFGHCVATPLRLCAPVFILKSKTT